MQTLMLALALAASASTVGRAGDDQAGAVAQPPSSAACVVADDPRYAFTAENPVQVGGGAMYGPARLARRCTVSIGRVLA